MESPTKEQVLIARQQTSGDAEDTFMTQEQAAAVIGVSVRQWQRYESGASIMPAGLFELFKIKTGPK